MRRCPSIFHLPFALSALLVSVSTPIFAQEAGEQITYSFTDITIDDPDLTIGAGLGMYLPGLVGYELTATANELMVPGLWGDFSYISSMGLNNDATLLGDGSELKLRAGLAMSGIYDSPSQVTLSSQSWTSGDKRYTKTTYLPVDVPMRKSLIAYGTLAQRKAVFVEKNDDPLGDDKVTAGKTTNMIGAGVRWQWYQNFTAKLENYGTYENHESGGAALELLQGDQGAFKGLHWLMSFDNYKFPWFMKGAVGTGITGLEKNVEILDTFVAQFTIGYAFTDSLTRSKVDFDVDCWRQKRDVDGCRK